MSKKIILSMIVPILAVGALALIPLAANAQHAYSYGGNNSNGTGNGISIRSELLGLTNEQIREQLQTKTMDEIVSERGMTIEQYHEKVQAASKNRWTDMGLSEEEITQRTQDQEARQADCNGNGDSQSYNQHRGQSR